MKGYNSQGGLVYLCVRLCVLLCVTYSLVGWHQLLLHSFVSTPLRVAASDEHATQPTSIHPTTWRRGVDGCECARAYVDWCVGGGSSYRSPALCALSQSLTGHSHCTALHHSGTQEKLTRSTLSRVNGVGHNKWDGDRNGWCVACRVVAVLCWVECPSTHSLTHFTTPLTHSHSHWYMHPYTLPACLETESTPTYLSQSSTFTHTRSYPLPPFLLSPPTPSPPLCSDSSPLLPC